MNDVRKVIYGTIIGFFAMLGVWFSIIYISSCDFTFTCHRGGFPVERTSIPTLIPVSHSESSMASEMIEFDKCPVSARDLVGAWVEAGSPETEAFSFSDVNGQICEGYYTEDIQPLLVENGVWQIASIGCISCHNSDLTDRSGGLDMTSYDAISGSGIIGSSWEASILNEYLGMSLTADGHSGDMPGGNPLIFAGTATSSAEESTTAP